MSTFWERFREGLDPNREERKKEWVDLWPKLVNQGYQPDEINQMAADFLRSKGKLNLLTERNKYISPPVGQEGPVNRTIEPIVFQKPEEALYNMLTGGVTTTSQLGLRPGTKIKTYNPTKTPGEGVTHFIDATSGNEIRTESNKEGKDKYISIDPTKGQGRGGGTLKDFQDQVALDVLKNYFTLKATGQDVSNLEKPAIGAATRFGMDINTLESEPKMWEKLSAMWEGRQPVGEQSQEPQFTPRGTPGTQNLSTPEDYLKSIGAKLTPANIEWARKKIGKK